MTPDALEARRDLIRELWPKRIPIRVIFERVHADGGPFWNRKRFHSEASEMGLRRPPAAELQPQQYSWTTLDESDCDEIITPDEHHLGRLRDLGIVFAGDDPGDGGIQFVMPRTREYRGIMARMPDPRMARAAEAAAMGRRGVL